MGSTAALQPGINPGDLIVSEGSFRNDGTSDAYVPKGYPAVPDLEITLRLSRRRASSPRSADYAVHAGLNATDDAFYAESPEWTSQMSALGLLNVEMESSALFVVARQRGIPGGDDLRGLEQPRRGRERVRLARPSRGRLASQHRGGPEARRSRSSCDAWQRPAPPG